MSSDRIAQLHEQASEHYLNGDYGGALQAWRDVLRLDPSNEQALDGVRMAAQFVERVQPAVQAAADVEHELDLGLKVLDGLAGPPPDANATVVLDRAMVDGMIDRKPAPAGVSGPADKDPARQSEGLDFGDLSAVEPIPLGDAPHDDPVPREEAYGLEPASPPLTPPTPATAAASELKRRVNDLLAEARSKAEAGERDEALAILSRLAILDEDNAEADALRVALEAGGAQDLDKIEQSIIEGVAALESDRLDDAERWFRDALALSPEHREAKHYLDKVLEKRAEASTAASPHDGEDLLGAGVADGFPAPGGEAPPSEDAVPLATAKARPAPRPPRAAAPAADELASPTRGRRSLPSPKWVLLGGLGAIAVVCGVLALPQLIGRAKAKPAPKAPPPSRAAAAKTSRPAPPAPAAAVPAVPVSPAERAKAVAASISNGQARLASGDFAGAVLSFNQALQIDPGSVEAKAGLDQAADRYRAQKAERESLARIGLAFRDGEYASALRLAYRLPPSVPKPYIDGVKLAGWYNLAVVALRAGDCKEAMSHLDEALAVAPSDADAKALREFSVRYAEVPKDRAFLDRVEALTFKPVPAS